MNEEEQALDGKLGRPAQSAVLLERIERMVADETAKIQLKGGNGVRVKGEFPFWTVGGDLEEMPRQRKVQKEYALQIKPIQGGSFGKFYFVPGVVNILWTSIVPTVNGVSVFSTPRPTLFNASAGCFVFALLAYTRTISGTITYDGTCELVSHNASGDVDEEVFTVTSDWDSSVSNFANSTSSGSGIQAILLDCVDRDNVPMNLLIPDTAYGLAGGSTEAFNQSDPNGAGVGIWTPFVFGSVSTFFNATGSRPAPYHQEANP